MPLVTEPNLADPDGLYQALVEAHRDLSPEASAALNARLILLLVNHIGDAAVIRQAIAVVAQTKPVSSTR